MTEGSTTIKIDLPLPMDIAGTLMQVIGLTWPNTVIKQDEARFPSERALVMEVSDEDRHKSAKARKKYEKHKQHLSKWDSDITELTPNAVGVSPHEYLAKQWCAMARQTMEMFPDAHNYLESVVQDRDTRNRWVFYVARSEGQTPHALRKVAEKRVEELEAEVAQLKAQLEEKGTSATSRKAGASSRKRSAGSSTATKSGGSAGTRKTGRSSSSGAPTTKGESDDR